MAKTFNEIYNSKIRLLCKNDYEMQEHTKMAKNEMLVVALEYRLVQLEATRKRITNDYFKQQNIDSDIQLIKALLDNNIIYGGTEILG